LGIPNPDGLQRGQLETEIRKCTQQPNPIIFAASQSTTTTPKKGRVPWGVVGAVFTAVMSLAMMGLTAMIAWANKESATTATNLYTTELAKWQDEEAKAQADNERTAEILNDGRLAQWQTTIVHRIIDRNTRDDLKGISFDDIRMQYVAEATTAPPKIKIPPDKLEPLELQRVLLGLEQTGLVYHLADDHYVAKKIAMAAWDRSISEKHALYAILGKAYDESGKYTVAELGQLIVRDTKITPDDFQNVLSELTANTEIIIKDEKVWSGMKLPPKKDK
jgi:hypothetical protein